MLFPLLNLYASGPTTFASIRVRVRVRARSTVAVAVLSSDLYSPYRFSRGHISDLNARIECSCMYTLARGYTVFMFVADDTCCVLLEMR